jgi:hypothetical protein
MAFLNDVGRYFLFYRAAGFAKKPSGRTSWQWFFSGSP